MRDGGEYPPSALIDDEYLRIAPHLAVSNQRGEGMAEYISESLQTPVTYECDVLVAGGGIAGVAAAIAAARQGAKVLLLEKQFMLGGLATAGLITIYLPLCDGRGHQVSFGLAEELLRLSIQYGYEAKYPSAWLEKQAEEQPEEQTEEPVYDRKTQRICFTAW